MKTSTVLVTMLALFLLAGCKSQRAQVHEYEYEDIRLAIEARATPAPTQLASAEMDVALWAAIDVEARQVHIEARLLSARRTDQSILGIAWWPGTGDGLTPTSLKDTTRRSSPVAVGFGIGTGGGGSDHSSSGHPPGCTCAQCRGGGGGGGASTGVGIGLPLPLGRSDRIRSVKATFDLPGTVAFEESFLALQLQVSVGPNDRIIAQPVLISVNSGTPVNNQAGPERPVFTEVTVADGRTVVLGGLVQDDQVDVESQVPVLNNVPLVSRLFRNQSNQVENKNLLIFIKPTIMLQSEQ